MKIIVWRSKVEDREEWNRIVEQTKTHPVATDTRVSYDTRVSVATQQQERMVVDPVNQYQKL